MSKPSSYHVTCRVSRYISRVTPRITLHTVCLGSETPQTFGHCNLRRQKTRFPDSVSGYFKKVCAERSFKCLPPWKGARVQIRAATKNVTGRPSLSAAFAENRKHRKLRGSLRSECQVPFSGVRLRKNTVKHGVVSDLSAKSPS